MKHQQEINYSLITGASSGIGKAIAYECARRNMNLILVALPEAGFNLIASDISIKYNVKVLIFEIDLTQQNAPTQLYEWCNQNGLEVNMLVSSAGIGYEGEFEKLSPEFCEKLMQINMQSMVLLTRLFVPELRKKQKAFILNVSSMASFSPMPYKSIYAASKSFVFSFTLGLREELRHTSVSVSVLCPGPMPTNLAVKTAIAAHGILIRLIVKEPEQVAAVAIKNLLRGNALIVPGIITKFYLLMMKILPHRPQQFILGWKFRKTLIADSERFSKRIYTIDMEKI